MKKQTKQESKMPATQDRIPASYAFNMPQAQGVVNFTMQERAKRHK